MSSFQGYSTNVTVVENMNLVDEHFSSYLHFTDFKFTSSHQNHRHRSALSQSSNELCFRTQALLENTMEKIQMGAIRKSNFTGKK